jgi:GNAT superfamily N-acetyltransferase
MGVIGPRYSVGTVKLEVRPVTKARWKDLVELFDRPGASIARGCFCMYYRRSGGGSGIGPGRENRAAMKALVDRGTVPGLIGYQDGRPVGWISLGRREDYAKLQRSPLMKPVDDKPVWSIVCFFVDAKARGQGVSEALLKGAMDYARSQGATLLEAYPVDKQAPSHSDFMWFGAKSMFDRAGFKEVARRKPTRPVVRRGLRPRPGAAG